MVLTISVSGGDSIRASSVLKGGAVPSATVGRDPHAGPAQGGASVLAAVRAGSLAKPLALACCSRS